jgi:hypothetical protein
LIEQAPRYSATLKDLIDRIQLSDLYRPIGRSAGRIDHFETVAAQAVEAIVRKEMARFGK